MSDPKIDFMRSTQKHVRLQQKHALLAFLFDSSYLFLNIVFS